MAPTLERAAAELEPGVWVCKLDTENAPIIAARFRVRPIPTLILFKEENELGRLSAATDPQLGYGSTSAAVIVQV